MKEKINTDEIIWVEANAVWLYSIMRDYVLAGKDLDMDFLSLGSLRYNEKYFVGYIYNKNNVDLLIELVSYIQYKMLPSKLTLNYMDIAKKYRGNGIAKKAIDEFANQIVINPDISVSVTSLSYDGKKADLIGKLQDKLKGNIVESGKRNVL